jgi:hypothetical protein
VKSFLQPPLKPDQEIRHSDAASVAWPAEPEFKQVPNTTTPSQAESLLAAEKRTLEMMANGASLSEVLNDLCAAIDAYAPPAISMALSRRAGVMLVKCKPTRIAVTDFQKRSFPNVCGCTLISP